MRTRIKVCRRPLHDFRDDILFNLKSRKEEQGVSNENNASKTEAGRRSENLFGGCFECSFNPQEWRIRKIPAYLHVF